MTFQIVSGLHLESPKVYDIFEITPKAPYLALLGDIGNVVPHKDDLFAFLTSQLKRFRVVLFVPGNHEAYELTWAETLHILKGFEEHFRNDTSIGEFALMDRPLYRLPETNIVVLGCSLFSGIPQDKEMAVTFSVNDFFQINDWEVANHNNFHRRDLAWLNEQVRALQGTELRIAIFTHWSPTRDPRSTDPKHSSSAIISGFSTDLSGEFCFASRNVLLWAFGHTHFNCDFEIERQNGAGPLQLLANQRGYYFSQASGFDVEKVVELGDISE